ncbi:MAG: hypothetical protein AAFY69_13670 [Pseudomonadota bacterium]
MKRLILAILVIGGVIAALLLGNFHGDRCDNGFFRLAQFRVGFAIVVYSMVVAVVTVIGSGLSTERVPTGEFKTTHVGNTSYTEPVEESEYDSAFKAAWIVLILLFSVCYMLADFGWWPEFLTPCLSYLIRSC